MQLRQFGTAIALLGIALLAFGFWANRSPQTVAQNEEQHLLAGTSTPEGDFEYQETGQYYDITAHYPAKTGLEASSDARARLAVEEMIVDKIAEFKHDTNVENLTPEDAAYQNLSDGRKYSLVLEYKTYVAPKYVSYLYTIFEDTGGAHPNTYFVTLVFNQAGENVTLDALFPSTQNLLKKISSAVEASVTEQYKERAEVTDTTGLLFTEGFAPKEENFKNFVIDGSNLRIFIPPYQVAAYVAGSFEVAIPLSQLQ